MFDIVGIGASVFDTILTLPSFPKEDRKVRSNGVLRQCGGPVATGLAAAARLGAEAAYLGLVAEDEGGMRMLEEFKEYGVCTKYIKLEKGEISPSAVVLAAQDKVSRTIIWNPGTLRSPEPEDIPEEVLCGTKLLHLDGHHWKAALYAANIVKAHGGKVLLDAGNIYEGTDKLVSIADIIIASEEFALDYTRENAAENSIKKLSEVSGAEILVVTQGAQGGLYLKNGDIYHYPAYPPPGGVQDTTGAGDVFHGAYAFAFTRGWNLEQCVSFSSAVSSLKCTKLGGRSGIPDYETARQFFEKMERTTGAENVS